MSQKFLTEASVDKAVGAVAGCTVGWRIMGSKFGRSLLAGRALATGARVPLDKAPIGSLQVAKGTGSHSQAGLWLKVNGIRQRLADLCLLGWSVLRRISTLSESFDLMPGDLVDSGLPQIVRPVANCDPVEYRRDRMFHLSVRIV